MTCCPLDMYMDANGDLFCNACRRGVHIGRNDNGYRCVIIYSCLRCGLTRHCDRGDRTQVKIARGAGSIVCE